MLRPALLTGRPKKVHFFIILYKKERLRYDTNKHEIKNETKYSRVDQVKLVESRL